jgi:hypothetical protein
LKRAHTVNQPNYLTLSETEDPVLNRYGDWLVVKDLMKGVDFEMMVHAAMTIIKCRAPKMRMIEHTDVTKVSTMAFIFCVAKFVSPYCGPLFFEKMGEVTDSSIPNIPHRGRMKTLVINIDSEEVYARSWAGIFENRFHELLKSTNAFKPLVTIPAADIVDVPFCQKMIQRGLPVVIDFHAPPFWPGHKFAFKDAMQELPGRAGSSSGTRMPQPNGGRPFDIETDTEDEDEDEDEDDDYDVDEYARQQAAAREAATTREAAAILQAAAAATDEEEMLEGLQRATADPIPFAAGQWQNEPPRADLPPLPRANAQPVFNDGLGANAELAAGAAGANRRKAKPKATDAAELSAYEQQRVANIAENDSFLESLGLSPLDQTRKKLKTAMEDVEVGTHAFEDDVLANDYRMLPYNIDLFTDGSTVTLSLWTP